MRRAREAGEGEVRLESKLRSNVQSLIDQTKQFKCYPTESRMFSEVLKVGSGMIIWVYEKGKEIGGGHR